MVLSNLFNIKLLLELYGGLIKCIYIYMYICV